MKKIILILLIFGISQTINAITIQEITVSPLTNSSINVHLKSMHGSCFYYNSYQYNILNNVITLQVCYNPQLCNAQTFLENDFIITMDNTTANNFTLITNVFFVSIPSFVCNYIDMEDTISAPFSTPLTQNINLSTKQYTTNTENIFLFPNPTNGLLEFYDIDNSIKSIIIFDNLSRIVKTQNIFQDKKIDLKELNNGIYFVKIITDKKSFDKKILIRK